jgi:hypothetical protein
MTGTAALAHALRLHAGSMPVSADFARRHGVEALLAHASGRTDVVAGYEAVAAIRTRELRRVLDACADAGIQPVVIKGAHLGHVLYASSALRPHGDVDIVVAPEELDIVARTVAPLGYDRLPHVRGRLILGQHHFRRIDDLGVPHALDVHWRIAAPLVFRDVLTAGVLRGRALPIPALGSHARGPSLPDALAIACVHLAAHHRNAPLLLWLYEIAALAVTLDDVDRRAFLRYAREARLAAICAWALEQAARCFDEEAVAGLIEGLRDRHAVEPSARILKATRPFDEFVLDFSSAGWGERLVLLREHLCPDADYMRRTSGAWLPLAYARRAARGARKWLAATPTLQTAESDVPLVDCPEASSSRASAKTSQ